MWTLPQLDKQMHHSFGNERKIHHSGPGEVQCVNLPKQFKLRHAAKFTSCSPCTNHLLRCILCPNNALAIWKCNITSHIIADHPHTNIESCCHFCLVKKPDCDLTRSLDRVVNKESAEETDSDEEVIKNSAEEGIPGPKEAKMLNNQELEGDWILVEHMLEITDCIPLSSEVSTSRAGRQHQIRHLEQDELIHTDFICEQVVLEKVLLHCSSLECNFTVSSPAASFPPWH